MILLVGGTGYVGRHVAVRLAGSGAPVRCLVRPARANTAGRFLASLGFEVRTGDLDDADSVRAASAGVRLIVSAAPIGHAPVLLACAPAPVERFVFFSSQRGRSGVPSHSVAAVQAGEAAVAAAARPCVVLRPTMIYGPGDDRNIGRIVAFVRRHGWFPVFGRGTALQQPVFVGDVAEAVHAAVSGRGRTGATYDLAGPEPLPFVRLLELIGRAVNRRVRRPRIPLWVALPLLRTAQVAGLRLPLTVEQVRRLQEDKACSIAAAQEDLGFAPLGFAAGLLLSLWRGEIAAR